jgi:hypothetical protein
MLERKSFCVYLSEYSGDLMPRLYIGSTSTRSIDLGYRGSVSSSEYKQIWKSEIKNNPNIFKTTILSYHETRKEAFDEETRLHYEFDVVNNPAYINKAYANGKMSMSGRKHTLETKAKMSCTKKDYWVTAERCEFGKTISNSKKSKKLLKSKEELELERIKMSDAQTKRTEELKHEHAKKISDAWRSQSKEKKEEISKNISKRSKAQFENMTEHQAKEFSKTIAAGLAKLPQSKKKEMLNKQRIARESKSELEKEADKQKWKDSYGLKSKDERKAITTKLNLTLSNRTKDQKEAYSKKLSESLKGKRGQIVVCPHCEKEGSNKVMYRWHFDKCKILNV